MKTCHVCLLECSDDAELCPLCGADLTKTNEDCEETKEEREFVIKNPVLLATMDDIISAEIFKDILLDNKIPFSSSQDESGSIRVLFGGSLVSEEIFVDEKDFDKANELYEEFLNSEETMFDEDFFEDQEEE